MISTVEMKLHSFVTNSEERFARRIRTDIMGNGKHRAFDDSFLVEFYGGNRV